MNAGVICYVRSGFHDRDTSSFVKYNETFADFWGFHVGAGPYSLVDGWFGESHVESDSGSEVYLEKVVCSAGPLQKWFESVRKWEGNAVCSWHVKVLCLLYSCDSEWLVKLSLAFDTNHMVARQTARTSVCKLWRWMLAIMIEFSEREALLQCSASKIAQGDELDQCQLDLPAKVSRVLTSSRTLEQERRDVESCLSRNLVYSVIDWQLQPSLLHRSV